MHLNDLNVSPEPKTRKLFHKSKTLLDFLFPRPLPNFINQILHRFSSDFEFLLNRSSPAFSGGSFFQSLLLVTCLAKEH
jgi:hypothetical protein